jgi:hypothetical protein
MMDVCRKVAPRQCHDDGCASQRCTSGRWTLVAKFSQLHLCGVVMMGACRKVAQLHPCVVMMMDVCRKVAPRQCHDDGCTSQRCTSGWWTLVAKFHLCSVMMMGVSHVFTVAPLRCCDDGCVSQGSTVAPLRCRDDECTLQKFAKRRISKLHLLVSF